MGGRRPAGPEPPPHPRFSATKAFLKHSLLGMRAGRLRINRPASNERRQLEHQHQSAERRPQRAGEAERKPSLRAKLARALSDLRANTLSGIALGPALGPLAAALILVSFAALGSVITLALLPLVLGVGILVALVAAPRGRRGSGGLPPLGGALR